MYEEKRISKSKQTTRNSNKKKLKTNLGYGTIDDGKLFNKRREIIMNAYFKKFSNRFKYIILSF